MDRPTECIRCARTKPLLSGVCASCRRTERERTPWVREKRPGGLWFELGEFVAQVLLGSLLGGL